MSDEDDKRKHLEFLQAMTTRMNSNSFQVKALTIAIVSGVIAVSVANKLFLLLVVLLPIVLVFWLLDSYYLQMERKILAIYKDVAGITTMHRVKRFDVPIQEYHGGNLTYFSSFLSPAIAGLYGSIIGLLDLTLLGYLVWKGSL